MAVLHRDWLCHWARVAPGREALSELESGRAWTYRELERAARRAGNLMRERLGVERGDRVAVVGHNRGEQIVLGLGAAKIGAVLLPINYRLSADEMAFVLGDASPQALFFSGDAEEAVSALGAAGWDGATVGFDQSGPGGWRELMQAASDRPAADRFPEHDDPFMLLYTSGTTGRPKGAVITHGNVVFNAVATCTSWGLGPGDVTLVHNPLFHTGGWHVLLTPLLHRGARVLLAERFDPAVSLRAIGEHRLTVLFSVPTQYQMMLQSEAIEDADFSSLRFCVAGGSDCPQTLTEAWQERGVLFKQGYGLTEAGPNCFVLPDDQAVARAGSVGFPVLYLDARVIGEDGDEAGPDEVGEIQLRGPAVCAGYWQRPEATAEAFDPQGWFRTGDLFRCDHDGYFHAVGRRKDMFISGGENVYPAEVERVLYGIPGVSEVAVVGVADPRWGEVGHAFLAFDPQGHGPLAEAEILARCRVMLASYKVPKGVTVLAGLPKSPSGKILKKELSDQARGGKGDTP